jgi:Ubiquitin-activating enzyme active site
LFSPVQVSAFEPRSGIKIAENDAALQQQQSDNGSYDQDRVKNIVDELKNLGKPTFKITPLDFEKDDDHNLHMDYIVAASNLRAANYKIPPADKHKVSRKSSKIEIIVQHQISFTHSRNSLLERLFLQSQLQHRWFQDALLLNCSSWLKGELKQQRGKTQL